MDEKAKFRWDEQRAKDNELFRAILNNTNLREKLFTEKFIEGLEKRKDALEARGRSLDVVRLTMLLLLLVAIVFPDMSVSALGLSAKAASFRELLLVVIASLQIHAMPPAIEQARIADFMHVYLQKQAEGNQIVLLALTLRYGIARFSAPDLTARNVSKRQKIYLVTSAISMLLWIVGVFLLFMLLLVGGMISIIIHPTLSIWVSILVCMYVIAAAMMDVGMRVLTGFIPNMTGPNKG